MTRHITSKYSDYRNVIRKLRLARKNILIKMKSGNYFILLHGITEIAFLDKGITAKKCGPEGPAKIRHYYDFVFIPYESIDNIRTTFNL